jgi:cell division protein ZipA
LLYGDLDIYHRHETTDTASPVQFSVASAVEPGTFTPAEIGTLSTPGISFFMSLPGPGNALQAFNFMYETAQAVVRNLGGELKDERRSVMTSQTAEHCRQRIREFERKQRSKRD